MLIQELPTWEMLQKELTWRQLGEMKGKRILDFGCGNGVMSAYYAKANHVTAIDPDAHVLQENPYPDVEQICGDVNALAQFVSESFDVIFCHNVLEYADERERIVQELSRVLKSDGVLSILKHHRQGRILQMAVLLNRFDHANELLDGKDGSAAQFGVIHYYEDQELCNWAPQLTITQVWGMKTFYALQQNQDIQRGKQWQSDMLDLEMRVSSIDAFKSIAFFHHILLSKNALGKEGAL